jgi:hypothetical protein
MIQQAIGLDEIKEDREISPVTNLGEFYSINKWYLHLEIDFIKVQERLSKENNFIINIELRHAQGR